MKTFYCFIAVFLMTATSALATVTVSSPSNGATVGSPVAYVATATTTTCSTGVASMGIYVDGDLVYVVNGASMNTTWPLAPGTYSTVVEEWDHCGGATYTTHGITVAGQNWRMGDLAREQQRRGLAGELCGDSDHDYLFEGRGIHWNLCRRHPDVRRAGSEPEHSAFHEQRLPQDGSGGVGQVWWSGLHQRGRHGGERRG